MYFSLILKIFELLQHQRDKGTEKHDREITGGK